MARQSQRSRERVGARRVARRTDDRARLRVTGNKVSELPRTAVATARVASARRLLIQTPALSVVTAIVVGRRARPPQLLDNSIVIARIQLIRKRLPPLIVGRSSVKRTTQRRRTTSRDRLQFSPRQGRDPRAPQSEPVAARPVTLRRSPRLMGRPTT